MQLNSMQIDRLRIFRARISFWIALAFIPFFTFPFDCHAGNAVGQNANWEITADQITYNQNTNTYTAKGNVRISSQGRILTADKARLDQTSHQAWAEGNVRLLSGPDILTGSHLELNLENETGALSEGKVFLAQNHLYVRGKLILKTGPQTYFAKNAAVTTCDGPDPDWHITGKDLKVTIEGYGFIKSAAFWADGIPLMYTPYLFFPVKLKRQTGFLAPQFGVSNRKGFDYLQPFFWAINDNTDATFFTDYMTERGLRLGAEYRYVASEHSYGTFMLDGFHDRQIDDGLDNNSERWGYPGFLRTNRDRYWLRGKANQDLPLGMTAKLDVDVVSDQDYLQDFKTGFNGYDQTRAYFLKTFGRTVDDSTDLIRENQLNINRLWTSYGFNANVRWYQDSVHDRPPNSLSPLQELPELTMDGIKQKIDGTPLYYSLNTSYINFYQESGDSGQRADVYPRVYYPTRLFNAISVEPSAGIRETAWHVDHYETTPADNRRDFYRTLYDLRLDTSTDFDRIYAFHVAGCDRLKHDIRPQIIYQYIPNVNQNNDPDFDAVDRIDGQNLVTFALTNTLIARRPALVHRQGPAAEYTYIPFLRFRLEDSLDINKYREDNPRPWTNVSGELDVQAGRYVLVNGDFLWSPYDGEFYGYNLGMNLRDPRGDRLNLNYNFTRETAELQAVDSINVNAAWKVTPRWLLRGSYEKDLQSNQFISSGFGVTYFSQCWGVDLNFTQDENNNKSVAFMVRLAGLGNLGV